MVLQKRFNLEIRHLAKEDGSWLHRSSVRGAAARVSTKKGNTPKGQTALA
jgi:hypothetical protein